MYPSLGGTKNWPGTSIPFAPLPWPRHSGSEDADADVIRSLLLSSPSRIHSAQPSDVTVRISQVSPQSGPFHGFGSSFSQAARSLTGSRDAPPLPLLLDRGLL